MPRSHRVPNGLVFSLQPRACTFSVAYARQYGLKMQRGSFRGRSVDRRKPILFGPLKIDPDLVNAKNRWMIRIIGMLRDGNDPGDGVSSLLK